MKDKDTGQNKGYAFVTFMNEENAEKAIETLNDSEVKVTFTFCYFDSTPSMSFVSDSLVLSFLCDKVILSMKRRNAVYNGF